MNFGQNLFNWFLTNAQSLILMGIVFVGVYLLLKREMSKMVGFVLIAIVAVGFVFNSSGVKEVMLNLFNTVFGV